MLISIGALQLSVVLVGVGRAKALAVLLGPAGFGIVATIDQIVMTIVQFGGFGLPFVALKFMARAHSEGMEAFRTTMATFLSVVGLLAVMAAALASAILAYHPGLLGDDLIPYRTDLEMALLGVLPLALNAFLVSALAAAQRPAVAAAFALAVALGLALCAVIGSKVGGIRGLYVATATFGVVSIPVSLAFLHRVLGLRMPGRGLGLARELRRSPQIIPYAVHVYLTLVAYSLGLLLVRYVVLADLGGAAAGLLQASLTIALTSGLVLGPMSNLYLAPLVNRNEPPERKSFQASAYAEQVALLLTAGALPLVLFPGAVLTLLYTSTFTGAASVLFLFVLWQCLYQMVNVYQQLLIGLDDVLFVAVAGVAGFGTAALLAAYVVPRLGLGGAAGALVVGAVLQGALIAARLGWRHGMNVPARFLGRAGYLLVVVVAGGVLFDAEAGTTLQAVALRGGFAIGVLGLMWLLLHPAERALIASGPRSVRARWQAGKPT